MGGVAKARHRLEERGSNQKKKKIVKRERGNTLTLQTHACAKLAGIFFSMRKEYTPSVLDHFSSVSETTSSCKHRLTNFKISSSSVSFRIVNFTWIFVYLVAIVRLFLDALERVVCYGCCCRNPLAGTRSLSGIEMSCCIGT